MSADVPPSESNAQAGKQMVGGFEILSKVGKGGMGTVFRARQVSMDRVVALKILPPHLARDQQFVVRFLREAQSAARLNHPNIVQAFDAGKAGGYHYFAMEFVDGQTLNDLLRTGGPLPERRALEIVRDVARALDYAHGCGIIHRDIKPDNILIASDGTVKLADLGLARETTQADASLTQAGTAVGTPNYISPEQVRGETDLDGRCDIYALGATFYHLLAGAPPYAGGTGAEVMAKHLTAPIPDPRQANAQVSYDASRIIRKAMAKVRDHRYATAKEFLREVDALLAAPEGARYADGASTGAVAVTEPAGLGIRKAVYAAGGLAVLIAAAVAGITILRNATPETTPPAESRPPIRVEPEPRPEPEPETEPEQPPAPAKPGPDEAKERQQRLAAVRSEIQGLTAADKFGEALKHLAEYAEQHPGDLGSDQVAGHQQAVRFRARQRYAELALAAESAINEKDFAKARATMAALESFGIPEFVELARKKLAEIASREKHAELWTKWEEAKGRAKELSQAGKYDEAIRVLSEAQSLSLEGIDNAIREETDSVGAMRRQAEEEVAAAYKKESDGVWALFKERKCEEAEKLLGQLSKDKKYKLAKSCMEADAAAAGLLKEFWAAVERGIAARKGGFIAFAGAGGRIESVQNGEVTMSSDGVEHKRHIHQLAAGQALAYSGLQNDPASQLTVGVFLLAEGRELESSEKALAAAKEKPHVGIYKNRLDILVHGETELAARRLWEQVNSRAAKSPLTKSDLAALAGILREFDAKYDKTKCADSVRDKIAQVWPMCIPVYDKWPFEQAEARQRQRETAETVGVKENKSIDLGNGVTLELVLIPAGEFSRGGEDGAGYWRPQQDPQIVRITRPFYIGKYEVTQEQWERLLPNDNPSQIRSAKCPVEGLSWNDCQRFIAKLNALGQGNFRLPTEAEWEFACRAGTATPYYFGERITPEQVNFNLRTFGGVGDGFRGRTTAVGSFPPNAFVVYDMHGNVSEWCADWHAAYPPGIQTDPQGPQVGQSRVLRGGYWNSSSSYCRSAYRYQGAPSYRGSSRGFRVAVACSPYLELPSSKATPPAVLQEDAPARQKFLSRPDMPELEWRPGSEVLKGVRDGADEWSVRLPFEAGQVREFGGLWIVTSQDQMTEAIVGPRDGRIIRLIQKR